MSKEKKVIKFILNGCDISFIATAPADMTVEQLVKQGSRIIPDWCACGVCADDTDSEPEIVFDYNDVKKANKEVSCSIKPKQVQYAQGTPISWLISCPASDGNFKNALKNATMSELQLALEEIPQEGNKTKRAVIEGEIKRRNK